MNEETLKIIFRSWYGVLNPILYSKYFSDLLKNLEYLYENKEIYPEQSKVFKTFQLTNYNDLKVVILGMDPYPNNKANGLAFSNALNTGSLSPSLKKIEESIELDYYNGLNLNFDQTLENWARQGVLLINTALTVEKGKPGSHFEYWKEFTETLLKRLSEYNSGIIYCLWGKNAQEYTEFINTDTNYVLYAEHPSYAARNGRKWEFSFKYIDNLTYKLNGDKIKW